MGVLTRGLRVLDTALEKLVRELMTGNVDDALLRLVVRDLRSGKLLSQGFRRSIGDAEALLKRLSALAKTTAVPAQELRMDVRRRAQPGASRSDPQRVPAALRPAARVRAHTRLREAHRP